MALMPFLSVVTSTLFDLVLPSASLSDSRSIVSFKPMIVPSKVLVALVSLLPSTSISASLAGSPTCCNAETKPDRPGVLPLICRSLPVPLTPESITNFALPSDVLMILAVKPKLSPLLFIFLRTLCSESPALTSTENVLSPALKVSVPSSVIKASVELSKVPSNLLVVANLLTVILY
ncbi:hypothetical protein D3C80_1158280 [compost metagenome]